MICIHHHQEEGHIGEGGFQPAQIVRSPNPRKLRGVGSGGGDKGVSPGGVHFLSNEAVRHTAC